MAKLIRKHFGKVVSVEPTAPSDIDRKWSWHKAYEGFYGIIHVYQSRHRFPGKYFIVIYDIELNYLKIGVRSTTARQAFVRDITTFTARFDMTSNFIQT